MSALLFLGQMAPLLGNPTGGAVVAGAATIGSAGATLDINQSTQHAIINWQQFSIANGELTKFVVPTSGASLNRVVGGNPSAIYGALQSNGTLYLVNPSGIVVGPSGRIDTAGFLASTLDVTDQQFLAGGNLNFAGSSGASIKNEGTIHASTGDVYLIANQVNNHGTLSAPQGTVGLAAGNDVLFQQAGSQNLFVQATPVGTKRATGVTNAGTIRAAAAELKAAGGNAYALAINNTGVIAATGYKKINGQVYLTSDGGSISNSGTIMAGTAKGNGGTILVDGTATTSATSGTVTNSGTLDASATLAGGSGGTITLKNTGGTTAHSGQILALGGTGGVGGNAEISGANLGFTGTVDLTAFGGKTGNLLLDPATLDIITGGGSNLTASTVDPSAVVSALNGANVTLSGTTSITVTNTLDASGNNQAGNLTLTTPTLTLNAPIILRAGSTLQGSATAVEVGAAGVVQNALDASSTTSSPTISLASGTTYGLTSALLINKSLTFTGNGATLNGQNEVASVITVSNDAVVTLGSLTVTGGTNEGIYNNYGATLTVSGCTITGNGSVFPYSGDYSGYYTPEGGIYNDGTLQLGGGTTVTGNTGYYTGGIYNDGSGTITGMITNAEVNGNTATFGTAAQEGTDFYNAGTGTYAYTPDGGVGTTSTINGSAYSSGSNAAVAVASNVATLVVDAPVNIYNGATVLSTAPTVDIGAGSGIDNGLLIQGGIKLAGSGGTVNLAPNTTYDFDDTTGNLAFSGNVVVAGQGATLNGQSDVESVITVNSGAVVTLGDLTVTGGTNEGIYNNNGCLLTLNGCTISGNGSVFPYSGGYAGYYTPEGGIYNDGTLQLGSGTTVTGNTGYYTGGIYNDSSGTITSAVTSAQVNGNTASYGTASQEGTDFYNVGTGTFDYLADGGTGTTLTINDSTYSSGTGAAIELDPSVTTVEVNSPVNIVNGATVTSTAAQTIDIAAGSGTDSGSLIQGGVALAASGATVNLAMGATYDFDDSTGGVHIGGNLILNGNGAILDGSAGAGTGNGVTRLMEIDGTTAGVTVTLNDLTLENGNGAGTGAEDSGDGGGLLVYAPNSNQATVTMNNCTVTGNTSSYGGGGIYIDGSSSGNATLTLTNTLITDNSAAYDYSYYSGGGIYNNGSSGTAILTLTNTTVTGNSGYTSGGIYNNAGTITGVVNSSQVYGNTATYTAPSSIGADFYNTGTATFEFNPDSVGSHTATINESVYSSGMGAAILVDPTVTTLNINAPVTSTGGATVTSSATTVNIAAGSGTENGYLIQSGLYLAGSGATVNLAANTTYDFDGTTGGLTIGNSVTLAGNDSTLNGQNVVGDVMEFVNGGQTVVLNNLTLENGSIGIDYYYYNNTGGLTATLNNVTIMDNSSTGIYNYNYYGYADTLTLNNCTVSGNGSSEDYYSAGGIYNNNGTLNLNNCLISNNGNTNASDYAGGIYNSSGTITLDSATIVTGNTGYYAGGIYNSGTINGTVNSSQVYGNTATSTTLTQAGADFYNTGTATFAYNPDGEANNSYTIAVPIYSSGSGAVVTVDPSLIGTLSVNAPVNIVSGATFNSSAATVNVNAPMTTSGGVFNSLASTVNVAAGSGTENGYLVQGGVALAGPGGTVNLAANTTYDFDNYTSSLSIGTSLTLAGNGAILNGQNVVGDVIDLLNGGQTVVLNNLTVENGSTGIDFYYYNNTGALTATLNNVTITGNTTTGIYNYNYYGYADTLSLNNCTISGNGATGDYYEAGGIYNGNGIVNLSNCTINNNGSSTASGYAGAIYNSSGTITLDSATTITGNTGEYAGGIYNSGTIIGTISSSQVHGNTATSTNVLDSGADFYNTGTATFAYNPDGEANNSYTIAVPIYSSGSGGVVTVDPSLTGTLNVNAPLNILYGATFNSTAATVNINSPMATSGGVFNSLATTVNVGAGSGTENGYWVQGGVALAGPGGTVNLAANTTYDFDGTTSGLTIGNSVILAGNGATLNGQNAVSSVIDFTAGGQTVTLNNLTVENGSDGIDFYYYNDVGNLTATLNNVIVTGNSYVGIYNDNYYDYTVTLNLNHCAITGNGTSNSYVGGILSEGVLNIYDSTISGNQGGSYGAIYNSGTLTATDCTFTGNTANAVPSDVYNAGTYTCIADANAATPNTLTYTNADTNEGTATYQATTINWNAPFTNNGNLTLAAVGNGAVTINSPITSNYGQLLIQGASDITLNAAITSIYGNIVLVDTNQFLNNVGADALSTSGGYTWQVWSANPPSSGQGTVDNDNGLTPDFVQYNAIYGVTPPAADGNGLLYSYGASLGVTLNQTFTKTYDGSTSLTLSSNSYSFTATGQLNGESVNFTNSTDLVGTLNNKDVDTATTVNFDPSQLSISVTQSGIPVYGYAISSLSAPATVTPAGVTALFNPDVTDAKIYDGTTSAPLAADGAILEGVVGGDSLALTAATGTYSDPHVGLGKAVTFSGLSLTATGPTDGSDYTLVSTTISGNTGEIDPATVTAGLAGAVTKTYDGTTTATLSSANYTLSGVVSGDIVDLNDPVSGTYATPNAGTNIPVSVSGLAISGANAGDYVLGATSISGNVGVINSATVGASITGSLTGTVSKVYDGTNLASNLAAANYALTGVMNGDSVFLTGPTTGTYASVDVGTGIVVTSSTGLALTGPQAGNYTLANTTASGPIGIITPATLTASLTGAVSKTYDGTNLASNLLAANYALAGVMNGDSVSLTGPTTGTYASMDVGTGIVVTSSTGLALTGSQAGNYTLANTTASGPIGIITPATLTASLTGAVSKTYDGSNAAALSPTNVALAGVISGDTIGVNGTAAYGTQNVGTNELVTVSGLALTGSKAVDYTVTPASLSADIGTITPASLTITAPHATITPGSPLPAFNATYSGLAATDSVYDLTGTLAYQTTATVNSPIGMYPIDVSGVSDPNYQIQFVAGTLTIANPSMTMSSPPSATAGSNIVPPVLTPTAAQTSSETGASDSSGNAAPPSINVVGSGTSVSSSEESGSLAAASGNSGRVGKGDAAEIGRGQVNNVASPHATGALNQALGPAVFQNLNGALQGMGNWTYVNGPGSTDVTARSSASRIETADNNGGTETILRGGDAAEVSSRGVKNISLTQVPDQLRKALGEDFFAGLASAH
jgi:filamentous hemagglutinin family protein